MLSVRLPSRVRARSLAAVMSPILAVTGVLFAPAEAAAQRADADWPSQVRAAYKISFTAFGDIGTFNFQSNVTPDGYTVTADAKVKVPLVYTWATNLNAAGRVAGEKPVPAAYNFTANGKAVIGSERNQTIRMGFRDSNVAAITILPPSSSGGPGYVPLTDAHKKDVLDPLTAILAMTRVKGDASPCNRRLAIFDGKQRFDLVLSPGGTARVPEIRPSGQPVMGPVCKVRYVPVAGFKDNEDSRRMANQTGMQIAFRPVPSANLVVPYQVILPTQAGTATITLQRMDIIAPGQKQIALVH
jgi:Protein of unknown function (DUF3108)